MGRSILLGVGIVLLVPAFVLAALDLYAISSALLFLLALLAIFTSFMTGKKLAAYIHDLHLASERKYTIGPALFIYAWLAMFIVMVLLYTLFKISLGYFVKLLFLPLGGAYLGMVYNLLLLAGAYFLFSAHYQGKGFVTLWGRAAEKSSKTMDRAKDAVMNPVKTMKGMSEEVRKRLP